MGGTFIKLDLETAEASGGYARELSADRGALQRELLAPHVAEADVLITTAAVPGRRAPLLVSRQMVQGMRPGSVVVDLAAESGGNVEGVRSRRGHPGSHRRRPGPRHPGGAEGRPVRDARRTRRASTPRTWPTCSP